MGTTGAPADIVTVEGTEKVSLKALLNALASSTNNAFNVVKPEDTGWLDVTIGGGFAPISATEKPQVRRIGNTVWMRGGWLNTGIAANMSYSVGTLPAGFAPTVNVISGIGSSIGNAIASGFISTAGDIQIRTSSTRGAYYMFGGLSWLVD